MSFRAQLYRVIDQPRSSSLAFVVFMLLLFCIFLSILVYFLKTVPEWADSRALEGAEVFCTGVFTLELASRLFIGTLDPWRLILHDMTLFVDAASIVPFYVERGLGYESSSQDVSRNVLIFLQMLQLLRLLRVLKLLRHYSGWRVLIIALERSWRAICVPAFAMLITILVLSGLLYLVEAIANSQSADEGPSAYIEAHSNLSSLDDVYEFMQAALVVGDDHNAFNNAFEAMWAVFWLVTTLGYDGPLGTGSAASRLVVAVALICGLLFTTMPITIIGGAFASAWEQKEVVEVAMKVQELLVERGYSPRDVKLVFDAFDGNESGSLDWIEFKAALHVLHVDLGIVKMRRLFQLFDNDESGTIDCEEFCRLLFPAIGDELTEQSEQQAERDAAAARAEEEEDKKARGGVLDAADDDAEGGGGCRSRVVQSPRETCTSSTAPARSPAVVEGKASWHQWRASAKREGLFSPDLPAMKQGANGDDGDEGGGSSFLKAAVAETQRTRRTGGHGRGVELDDLRDRMARLEDSMAEVIELLRGRPPTSAPPVSGSRVPPIKPLAGKAPAP